jgi:hypothetical protein
MMLAALRPVTAAELLTIWDAGQGLTPARRAVLLLATASDQPFDAPAALSVGQRDAALLTLREWCFGSRLESVAVCPACNEHLELAFNAGDIRVAAPPEPPAPLEVTASGWQVRFRLPTAADLVALAEGAGPASGATLFQRCVLAVTHNDAACTLDAAPAALLPAVAEAMAAADPQADVRLALHCPSCGHSWLAPFDILTFFWAEIEAWALRTLRDVHTLAQAYGWSEAAILALSPLRRLRYLELVRQ